VSAETGQARPIGVCFPAVKIHTFVPLVVALALSGPVRAQEPPAPPAPAAPAAPQGTPHASFEKTEIDAGEITRGKDLPVSFVVKNMGDGVLKILSAKPG